MTLRPFLTFLILLAAWAIWPAAGEAQMRRAHPVKITAAAEPTAAPGAFLLTITATVDPEYHVYAMRQPDPSKSGPVPTEVIWDDATTPLFAALPTWTEPTPTIKYDEGFEFEVASLYGSPLVFKSTVQLALGTAAGEYTLAGGLLVQACTESTCLVPKEIPFSVTVKLSAPVTAIAPVAVAPTPTPAPAAATPAAPTNFGATADLEKSGIFSFMLKSFLFGLIALATPCVFPMIPITVSFFTAKGKRTTGQAITASLVYVLSIIAGFTLVGFGISLLLLLFGGGVQNSGFANWIAANPWVNLFFGALYLVFALSLLEVLELSAPPSITAWFNKRSFGREDHFGIAMKAMVFVIVSFTCTAPLIGVLIVQTLSGDWTRPLVGMMAFSTGFALPFFALALAPQMLGSLPKAGGWLFATKVTMALLVLAASLKFISNADLVWTSGNPILTREVLLAAWSALAFATAAYLLGMVRFDSEEASGVSPMRFLTGSVFLALALYLAAGLFGAKLHIYVESYMPPDLGGSSASVGSEKAADTRTGGDQIAHGLSWYTEVEPALAQAKALGKPVFIDFTGYSCTNCRLMEKNIFPRSEIHSAMSDFVRVKLYTDDREKGSARQEYQAKTFGTVTLPFYATLRPDGTTIATAEYTTDAAVFAAFLAKR